jgi:hypothetical protein
VTQNYTPLDIMNFLEGLAHESSREIVIDGIAEYLTAEIQEEDLPEISEIARALTRISSRYS